MVYNRRGTVCGVLYKQCNMTGAQLMRRNLCRADYVVQPTRCNLRCAIYARHELRGGIDVVRNQRGATDAALHGWRSLRGAIFVCRRGGANYVAHYGL
eukprot:7161070-Pyramimonas_sp.AAC.1